MNISFLLRVWQRYVKRRKFKVIATTVLIVSALNLTVALITVQLRHSYSPEIPHRIFIWFGLSGVITTIVSLLGFTLLPFLQWESTHINKEELETISGELQVEECDARLASLLRPADGAALELVRPAYDQSDPAPELLLRPDVSDRS